MIRLVRGSRIILFFSASVFLFSYYYMSKHQVNYTNNTTMLFNALIRTHHITSRKKIAVLKKAADTLNCFALLRTGGSPGVMYVEGRSDDVEAWVSTVQRLRYKDCQLAARPAPVMDEDSDCKEGEEEVGLREVESVREFGCAMKDRGVLEWWRKGMGYVSR